jgi:hypothetical protein
MEVEVGTAVAAGWQAEAATMDKSARMEIDVFT